MISQEEYWYLWQFFTATAAEVRSMSVLLEKGVQTPSESHSSAPMVNLEGLLSLTLPHMIHSSGSIEPAQDTGHSKIPSQCFPFGGGGEGLYLCSVLCLLSCLLACFVGSLHNPGCAGTCYVDKVGLIEICLPLTLSFNEVFPKVGRCCQTSVLRQEEADWRRQRN